MGAGLSQHQLARAAHIAANFPGRMERGMQQPTLSTLIALTEALGVQPTMLVSLTVGRLRREAQP
jgi:transcriptional regulator with XRE-family HTH domain